MQSAVSQVTVGEEVQLVFCHVNFYIREERGESRATGWEERFASTAVVVCIYLCNCTKVSACECGRDCVNSWRLIHKLYTF